MVACLRKGVIETVPLDPPVCLFFGCLIAMASYRQIRRENAQGLSRFVAYGAGFGLWFGLTVTYFYFNYADWMWAYTLDSQSVPTALGWPLFMSILTVAGGLGAFFCQEMIRLGKMGWAWGLAVYALLVEIAIGVIMADQYKHVGTYQEYLAGTAMEAAKHTAFQQAVAIAGPIEGLTFAALVIGLWWKGRQVAKQDSAASHA